MEKPRVKPEHDAFRTRDGNVRIGGGVHGIAAEIEDPDGWAWSLVSACDGTRGVAAIVAEVRAAHPYLSEPRTCRRARGPDRRRARRRRRGPHAARAQPSGARTLREERAVLPLDRSAAAREHLGRAAAVAAVEGARRGRGRRRRGGRALAGRGRGRRPAPRGLRRGRTVQSQPPDPLHGGGHRQAQSGGGGGTAAAVELRHHRHRPATPGSSRWRTSSHCWTDATSWCSARTAPTASAAGRTGPA